MATPVPFRAPVQRKTTKCVCAKATFPSDVVIHDIQGETADGDRFTMRNWSADAYGCDDGILIDDTYQLQAGTYRLCAHHENAKDIVVLVLSLDADPVSAFDVAQMVIGLYEHFQVDVADVMGYPVRAAASSPSELDNVKRERDRLYEKLSEAEDYIETYMMDD